MTAMALLTVVVFMLHSLACGSVDVQKVLLAPA